MNSPDNSIHRGKTVNRSLKASVLIENADSAPVPDRRRKKMATVDVSVRKQTSFITIDFKDSAHGLVAKLTDNVKLLHTRFLRHGKLTVQLIDPNFRIYIEQSSNLDELGRFVDTLKRLLPKVKCSDGTRLESQKNLPTSSSQHRLIITAKSQYPIRTGFPSNLTHLTCESSLGLTKFDLRLTTITTLTYLNLSGNGLRGSLPSALGRLARLVDLDLSSNQLTRWPELLDEPKLPSLERLNLAHNNNKTGGQQLLPDNFWQIRSLVEVDLTDINLCYLPDANLHRMSRLRRLILVNNRLSFLPVACVKALQFQPSDFEGNPFVEFPTPPATEDVDSQSEAVVDSLLDLAARKCRQVYSADRLQQLAPGNIYLEFGRYSLCLVCLQSSGIRPAATKLLSVKLKLNEQQAVVVPVQHYICSHRCHVRFKASPWKYAPAL